MDVSLTTSTTEPRQTLQEFLGRAGGITFGFGNQILFLVTVWYLFWFLRDGAIVLGQHDDWIVRDISLAVVFAIAHSLMLWPPFRRRLGKIVPQAFYDSLFSVVTCGSLLVLFFTWRTSQLEVWHLTGTAATAIHIAFYASWAALFYSLHLTGLGYQNGWTPFWYWLRKKKAPRREFKPRSVYKLIRHPVYLSFLGLIWFTPRMSIDHAVLTAVWTGYIFLGSMLKDRRLEFYIGKDYRDYQRDVPGYPLMPGGPLARIADNAPIPDKSNSNETSVEPIRRAA